MENNVNNGSATQEDSFSIKNFVGACVRKWYWFLISLVFFVGLGAAYVFTRQPKYERTMSVLIKDQDDGGGIGSIANSFASLGLVSTNTNVYNELISLLSPAVMQEVVDSLHLEMTYTEKGFPRNKTLYGKTQPFIIEMLDIDRNFGGWFTIDVDPDGSMVFRKFRKKKLKKVEKFNEEVKVPKGAEIVKTPLGRIKISANPRYEGVGFTEPTTIVVKQGGIRPVVEAYVKRLDGDLTDRDAEVIDLSIKDVSEERADDILNMVLTVYGNKYVKDKNRMSVATSRFIDERLRVIASELGDVDNEIMDYRQKNRLPDLVEAGKTNLTAAKDVEALILEERNLLEVSKYVADYVNNPANDNKVIPVISGGLGVQAESQIANYNQLLMTRDNIASSSSASNPIVKDYDTQLKGLRESIKKALSTSVHNHEMQLANLNAKRGSLDGQLAAAPSQEKFLRAVGREQNVKEALYLFLLQKREENELTQTFTADNTRVITPPTGSVIPVSPKKALTLFAMFLLGLLLPGIIIFLQESSNTKVRSRKDLERMSTPFIGEIPFIGKRKSEFWSKIFKKNDAKKLETMEYVVRAGSRDLINESFRIVRGNLDFMSRNASGSNNVIMVTSFNPASGKSFITYNLCASYAIKGKRVLLIDCDLRHGSASQYVGMPSKGITAYLNGNTDDWHKYVVKVEDQPGFEVLPIGHRPPNPAELLESSRMKDLIAEASKEYDVVFLDCPPVDVVVDTQILSPLADKTVFIVRAGLLEKSYVSEIDALYNEYRFKNMSILLNGTEAQFSRYGSGNHGYYGSAYAVQE